MMKSTFSASLSLAFLISWTASAQQGTPVASQNAVGYIKVTCEPNKFQFVQVPFNTFSGQDYKLSEIMGTSLPDLSRVFIWNVDTQRYNIYRYDEGEWVPSDPVIKKGTGIFVQASAEGTAASYDLYLYGEVPGATSNASTQQELKTGLNASGFPYPVATTLATSGLTEATADGDRVFMWNPVSQRYVIATRFEDEPGFEWNNPNTPIPAGAAFFISRKSAGTYSASVPYTWPNN